ncbi:divergent protein kinase domain 1B-like isoform X2 [Anneissia japonica]|uniref:divergent protein kinase domain 1B-like isoform X2 n=1 Tax=Anneissia japonica TaxID=1529436 RepID=UPI001425BA36|nr:divergent protein kinase domain 1B-like isoform X2 [Anneissia japonica]
MMRGRGLKKHRSHLKVKHVVLLWMLVFCLGWWFYIGSPAEEQLCNIHTIKALTCDRFKKGIITGTKCSEFCDTEKIEIKRCMSTNPSFQVYEGLIRGIKNRKKKVPDTFLTIKQRFEPAEVAYAKPEKGKSMDDFRIMLSGYLARKFGEGDHEDVVMKILEVADVNNDGKVSLAEAKTMWALLQEKEFLNTMLMIESDHIPKLYGFCGSMYITEGVMDYQLYGSNLPGFVYSILPAGLKSASEQAAAPQWYHKAHITVGLLEFVEEMYDSPKGNMHFCNANRHSIGYTNNFDVKVLDLDNIYLENKLIDTLKEFPCHKNVDCVVGNDCRSLCNMETQHCTGEILFPNLRKVCSMIYNYLLYRAPDSIKEKIQENLDKCIKLVTTDSDMQLKHSLILNELKNLLWTQIADLKKFSNTKPK